MQWGVSVSGKWAVAGLYRCSNIKGAVGARREGTPGVVRHGRRDGDTHPPLGRRTAAHVHAAAACARVVVVEPHMRSVHLGVGVLACKGGAGKGCAGLHGFARGCKAAARLATRPRTGSSRVAAAPCAVAAPPPRGWPRRRRHRRCRWCWRRRRRNRRPARRRRRTRRHGHRAWALDSGLIVVWLKIGAFGRASGSHRGLPLGPERVCGPSRVRSVARGLASQPQQATAASRGDNSTSLSTGRRASWWRRPRRRRFAGRRRPTAGCPPPPPRRSSCCSPR
eukprot:scaffold132_cov61-Phaeocystis_antarctica.AAC.3